MLGTKWPSITSTCTIDAPPLPDERKGIRKVREIGR